MTQGTLTYHYQVKIDMTQIANAIVNRLYGEVEFFELDGEDLIIYAKHDTRYKYWHNDKSMECPEENILECDEMVYSGDLEKKVLGAFHLLPEVKASLEVDDESEWEF